MRSLSRYLGAGERVVLSTRQHPFAVVRSFLDGMLLLTPLVLASWGFAGLPPFRGAVGDWVLRVIFVLMIAIVARLFWQIMQWEFERIVVTNQKVIHTRGVLNRRIASTPLAKASEFTVAQPILGRLCNYGSLVVDVPGGREQALHGLAYIPDPVQIYRMVSDNSRHRRTSEGGGTPRHKPPHQADHTESGTMILPQVRD